MLEPSLDQASPPAAALARPPRLAAIGRGLDRSVALLAGLSFGAELIVGTMLPILPLFAVELGATPTMLGLMVSISALASAGGQLIAGFVSDRVGPRRLLPVGMVAYAAATLLTAAAVTAGPLVALRSLSGLGSGVYIVGERLYLRQVVDRARLAYANGVIQAAAAVGVIIGPVIGGVLAVAGDLRSPFIVVGLASLFVAGVALLLPARRRADSAAEPEAGLSVAIGRLGLGILLLANLALAAGYGSFITTFAVFAADAYVWSTAEIGIAFSLFGLGAVTIGPGLGMAADRRGRRRIGALSTIPIVALAVALVLPTPSILVFPLVFLAGGGVAGFTAAWFALLGIATGGAHGGRAFGTVTAVSSLGVIVGALAAGQTWESVDIRAGMLVTVIAMALAGIILAAYPDRGGVAELVERRSPEAPA
jgi:DHA1 family bicyclomycin/chloramphenicol resistance-like MFS transporter